MLRLSILLNVIYCKDHLVCMEVSSGTSCQIILFHSVCDSVCCGEIQSEMQKSSLFQEGERAMLKRGDMLIHLKDVIFPEKHVLQDCDFKNDTS